MITKNFIRSLKFSFMTEDTRQGFAGCESATPMLAETPEGLLVVLDGDHCEVIDVENLECVDSRDGMTELLRSD